MWTRVYIIKVYKIVTGLDRIDLQPFILYEKTRGHKYKLQKTRSRTMSEVSSTEKEK